jgi:superfamily II DNA or RNA helicase
LKKAEQAKRRIEIEVLNAVTSSIKREDARFIAPAIEYEKVYWRKGRLRKEEVRYKTNLWTYKGKTHYHFLTGHLRRVLTWCRQNDIWVNFKGERPSLGIDKHLRAPNLDGIVLRPDQCKLVNKALIGKRGIIKAPTRSGKTIMQYAIVSAFEGLNTLFLAHTKDLVNQLASEGEKFGFNVAVCHGEVKDYEWQDQDQVVIMTRQTCANELKKRDFFPSPYFDIIIVDEAHHVSTPEGQYAQILSQIQSPLRFGFTATLPDKKESLLSLEGFIGPMIGELTIDEAIDKDILVKPRMVIKKAPSVKIPKMMKYDEVYDNGIVDNIERNRLIARLTREFIEDGSSVLILVTKIRHGENVLAALNGLAVDAYFVRGDTDTEDRIRLKRALIKKEIMCVIATTVWKEGINIPTLNVCINAAGGKSEITTLQSVGRSLTKVEGKDHAVIVDLFDPSHPYLISHFGERISIYCEQGWI